MTYQYYDQTKQEWIDIGESELLKVLNYMHMDEDAIQLRENKGEAICSAMMIIKVKK